jgi:hypothetical protein
VHEQDDHQLRAEAITVLGGEPDSIEDLPHGRRPTHKVSRVPVGSRIAVMKVLVDPTQDDTGGEQLDSTSYLYWARESEIYTHGLPAPYSAAGVRSPQELARFSRIRGVALWLEDVAGLPGSRWTPEHYRGCAMRLGQAQGALVMGNERLRTEPPIPTVKAPCARLYGRGNTTSTGRSWTTTAHRRSA